MINASDFRSNSITQSFFSNFYSIKRTTTFKDLFEKQWIWHAMPMEGIGYDL